MFPGLFVLGGGSDEDAGGFTVSELVRNLEICVAEKVAKVAPHQAKYPEWWLVFANHIGYRVIPEDRRLLRELFHVSHSFDRIILVNPIDAADAFEI